MEDGGGAGSALDPGSGVDLAKLRIAAIVPCHNEEAAVGKVVEDLLAAVPTMDVYVYDNRSTDATSERAREAGAIVRVEDVKGKGNVVRRAFGDLEADVYLLIDGDDTYDARASTSMIQALLTGPYDHVLGVREPVIGSSSAYRPGHERGNRVLNGIVGWAFGTNVGDMLSGYRVFSRRFVKSFPALSREFEIETELTVHSLALRVPQTSMRVGFKDRPPGSESKLRTYRDGSRIVRLILNLVRHERPVAFYGLIGLALVRDSDCPRRPSRHRVRSDGRRRTLPDAIPRLHLLLGGMPDVDSWADLGRNPKVTPRAGSAVLPHVSGRAGARRSDASARRHRDRRAAGRAAVLARSRPCRLSEARSPQSPIAVPRASRRSLRSAARYRRHETLAVAMAARRLG